MSLAAWLSVVALCALGATSPGPSLAIVLHHAGRGSRLRGVSCALAHASGVGAYALVTALGLAAFLARQPGLYRAIATAGALYLLWLAAGLLRSRASVPRPAAGGSAGVVAAARDGLVTALLNPKIALFFLALFSQFSGTDPDMLRVLVLTATAAGVDAAWYVLVALVVSSRAVAEGLRRPGAGFDRLVGGLLALAAIAMLFALWSR